MCPQYDFVFYRNLQYWQAFDNFNSLEDEMQFLLCLTLFQKFEKYEVEKKHFLAQI